MLRMWGRLAVFAALAERHSAFKAAPSSLSFGFSLPSDPKIPNLLPFKPRFLSSSSSSSREGGLLGGGSAMAEPTAAAAERLKALRLLLKQKNLDALIVDDSDPHGSEIPSAAFSRRTFLSHFDGSSGVALVTQQEALLWTDGRYFVQAEKQLPRGLWTLMKVNFQQTPSLQEYLKTHTQIRRLGADGCSTAMSLWRQLEEAGFALFREGDRPDAADRDSQRLVVALDDNPVDEVWGSQRPPQPSSDVYVHPKEYRGLSCREKVERAVEQMAKEGADLLLLSSLDDVAWLTNLRASDVPNSPTFYSYALIARGRAAASAGPENHQQEASKDSWRLLVYTDTRRVSAEAKASLASEGASLREYHQLSGDLRRILCGSKGRQLLRSAEGLLGAVDACLGASGEARLQEANAKLQRHEHSSQRQPFVWLDPKVSISVHRLVADERPVLLKDTPVTVAKAAKDAIELRGMVEAHEIDGAALAAFFCWFEKQLVVNAAAAAAAQQQLQQQECVLTEWSIKEAVDYARQVTSELFRGTSFTTISCLGSNCALAHYRPLPESCFSLRATRASDGGVCVEVKTPASCGEARAEAPMFLLDSGGQYLQGTTDVTRTLHLGVPTQKQKEAFTLVLKGVISLSAQKFPEGSKGPQLDVLARQHLWNQGLDYLHGTGHGVGHFLNVHEGPIGISPRLTGAQACCELRPGAVVSIEPGYYEDGVFGIRTENLAAVEKCVLSLNREPL